MLVKRPAPAHEDHLITKDWPVQVAGGDFGFQIFQRERLCAEMRGSCPLLSAYVLPF